MLVFQTNHVGVEPFSCGNTFFRSDKFCVDTGHMSENTLLFRLLETLSKRVWPTTGGKGMDYKTWNSRRDVFKVWLHHLEKNSHKIQWINWYFLTPFFHLLQYYLNMLSKAKIPIWLTEVDVLEKNPFKRADALETVMRTAFSNPNVQGLILWSFWSQSSWRGPYTSLVDGNDWQVSKNTTYPSLKATFTLTSHLGKNVGLGESRWGAVSQKRMMSLKDTNPPLYKQQGILAELAFAKTSGIVTAP